MVRCQVRGLTTLAPTSGRDNDVIVGLYVISARGLDQIEHLVRFAWFAWPGHEFRAHCRGGTSDVWECQREGPDINFEREAVESALNT